jgi:hypothetical protein
VPCEITNHAAVVMMMMMMARCKSSSNVTLHESCNSILCWVGLSVCHQWASLCGSAGSVLECTTVVHLISPYAQNAVARCCCALPLLLGDAARLSFSSRVLQ